MLDPEILVGDIDFSGNRTMRESIYDAIKLAILDGKLTVGERIVEKTFAEAFRVSRTPVREALRRLETEGHVEYIPRTGVVVSGISKADVIEVYRIRKSLEALMIEQVIENVTSEGLDLLKVQIKSAREAITIEDPSDVISNYLSFNTILMDIARLPRLKMVLDQITEYVLRFRRISAKNRNRRIQVVNEHENILLAIEKRDVKEAVTFNNQHLDHSLELILSELFS